MQKKNFHYRNHHSLSFWIPHKCRELCSSQTLFPIGNLIRKSSSIKQSNTSKLVSTRLCSPFLSFDSCLRKSKGYYQSYSSQSKNAGKSTVNFMKPIKFFTTSIYYEHYKRIVCPDMVLKQKIKSISELPKIEKIVLNTTSKKLVNEKKNILPGLAALELISGQKLRWILATKSIASFKLKKNQLIGCKVTLGKKQMYFFFEKLVLLVLPRVRDYHGLHSTRIQNTQNYSIGLSNLLISPELENHFEYFEFFNGMTITFSTFTKKKYSGILLLSGFQFPIK